jgi:hypothetical protein
MQMHIAQMDECSKRRKQWQSNMISSDVKDIDCLSTATFYYANSGEFIGPNKTFAAIQNDFRLGRGLMLLALDNDGQCYPHLTLSSSDDLTVS